MANPAPVLVSILRAGNAMLDGVLDLIPTASVAHIGVYRDHDTLEAIEYYFNGPADIAGRYNLIVDPMLATANSSISAISQLRQRGVTNLRLASILAAPEGIAAIQAAFPDVSLFIGAVDERLDDKGYIIPGLGDAGDRSFAT
jgi:uracil phosphoribosyltransferase